MTEVEGHATDEVGLRTLIVGDKQILLVTYGCFYVYTGQFSICGWDCTVGIGRKLSCRRGIKPVELVGTGEGPVATALGDFPRTSR